MSQPKTRILIFLVVFLLLTNIGMLVYFTTSKMPGRMQPPHGGDHRGPGITAFLQNEDGFTKEQLERLDSLKKQHRAVIKPLFDELGNSKDSFYHLLSRPNVSDSALQASANDIGRRQAALDLQFFKNFMTIRSLCTPEQLPKFDSAMPSLASKMMQPWQKNYPPHRRDSTDSKK